MELIDLTGLLGKIENYGLTPKGRWSAAENNTLVSAVIQLQENLHGYTGSDYIEISADSSIGIKTNDLWGWIEDKLASEDFDLMLLGRWCFDGDVHISQTLDMCGENISGVADPTEDLHATNKQYVDAGLALKADLATTLAGYGIVNAYTKDEVDAKLSSVYRYKGTVEVYEDLPEEDNEVGDVWNVESADAEHGVKAGDNVAWTGEGWDVLSGFVDLTQYATTQFVLDNIKTYTGGDNYIVVGNDDKITLNVTNLWKNSLKGLVRSEAFDALHLESDGGTLFFGDSTSIKNTDEYLTFTAQRCMEFFASEGVIDESMAPLPIEWGGTGVNNLAALQALVGGGGAVNLAANNVTGVLPVDKGGTGLNALGAVGQILRTVDGGMEWQNIGTLGLWFGTCPTASGTATKVVTIGREGFNLVTGVRIAVQFSNTPYSNSTSNLQLDVNSTGAKSVYDAVGNQVKLQHLVNSASNIYEFVYNGDSWRLVSPSAFNLATAAGMRGLFYVVDSSINEASSTYGPRSYIKFSNGLIMQWGRFPTANGTLKTLTFLKSFSSVSSYTITLSPHYTAPSISIVVTLNFSTTGLQVGAKGTDDIYYAVSTDWWAIGI